MSLGDEYVYWRSRRRDDVSVNLYYVRVTRYAWRPKKAATEPPRIARYLDDDDTALVCALVDEGLKHSEVAKKFEVPTHIVSGIIQRRRESGRK